MTCLLILTVGTGTAGKHSDVASGLARTVDLAAPRLYWLVPSESERSVPVADIIRDSVTCSAKFRAWSETEPYRSIADPDDIHQCRQVLREVIRAAKRELREGEKLLINPTGGTKQMSAGATLAALDEEIGEIVFTVGERQDGVVKTGTEVLKTFSTEAFFLERDLRIAEMFFQQGAFFAAGQLLKAYRDAVARRARSVALCLHEWQRLNHADAARHASEFSEDIAAHLRRLAGGSTVEPGVVGDLLASADELLRWGDSEEALARYYRAAEQIAKLGLAEAHGIREPYRLTELRSKLPAGCGSAEMLRPGDRGEVPLGLQWAWRILEDLRDPIAAAYFQDVELGQSLQFRNASLYGHGMSPVGQNHAQKVSARLRGLLRQHLPAVLACWSTEKRPRSLIRCEGPF